MQTQELLTIFKKTEKRINHLEELNGPGLKKKLKRFHAHGWKNLLHIVSRILIPNLKGTAKLFWGQKIELPYRDSHALRLHYYGSLVGNEISLIKFLINNTKPNDVFYDIGANYGFYSFLMSTIAKKGEVHTFEPSPNIFPYLAVNNQQQMHVNNIALSNTSGEMTFFNTINSGESGASTLHKERLTLDARHIYTEQRIQTQTLDQYTQTHTHPTIIKLDVEGAESEVIEGGIKTLQENKPTLIMEVWRGDKGDHFHKKALNLLKKLGYTPHILTIDGNLKKSTFDHFPIYTKLEKDFDNVVFK